MAENGKDLVDFSIKSTWLAIAKMYNTLGSKYGVTHSNGFVLLNIDKENGTPATKIAPLMGMEARSLTRILKTMEEEGLIYRSADSTDKRRVIIRLTQEGKVRREIIKNVIKGFYRQIESKVSEDELNTFFKVIKEVNHAIDDNLKVNWEARIESMFRELQKSDEFRLD